MVPLKTKLILSETFGCPSYIQTCKENQRDKVSATTRKGILVGFDKFNKNYWIFDYENNQIVNTHNVTFNKVVFPKRGEEHPNPFLKEEPSTKNTDEIKYNPASQPHPIAQPPQHKPPNISPRRSARIQNLLEKAYSTKEIVAMSVTTSNSKKFKEIENLPVKLMWIRACERERQNMEEKGV